MKGRLASVLALIALQLGSLPAYAEVGVLQGGVTRSRVDGQAEATVVSDEVSGVVYSNIENRRVRPRTDVLFCAVKDPEGDSRRNAAIMGALILGIGAAGAVGGMMGGGGGGAVSSCGGH